MNNDIKKKMHINDAVKAIDSYVELIDPKSLTLSLEMEDIIAHAANGNPEEGSVENNEEGD